MKTLREIAIAQQQSRPRYFDDAEKDRMVSLIIELAEEICVLRDALENCAIISADGKPATPDALGAFTLSDEIIADRLARHQSFFEQLFEGLAQSK